LTVLTPKEIRKEFAPTKSEIDRFFKNHPKLRRTPANVKRVKKRIRASKALRSPGKEVSFTQAAADWQIIYGVVKVGGVITYAAKSGNNNEFLHLIITVAGHEIDEIEKVYLDDEEVIFQSGLDGWSASIRRVDGTLADATDMIFMSVNHGNPADAANADLIAAMPINGINEWTADHKQSNRAHVYLKLKWNAIIFPDGVPDINFLVRGKRIRHPGSGTSTAYTNNPAAVMADILTDPSIGKGISWDKIDADTWEAAYDKCNETINLISGTEPRYRVNAVFNSSDSYQDMLETVAAAMGGNYTYINGKYKIYAADWRTPTVTLTEDDILGDIRVQTKLSRKESFNGVKGTFISPELDYEEVDFPVVKNDFYMEQDGNERVWEDVQFPVTTSASMAQRLAKIELERNRQSITVQITTGLRGLLVEPMDIVNLTISRFGWTNKTFELQESTIILEGDPPSVRVQMLLKEAAELMYAWNDGEETRFDIAPNTSLPSPRSVPAITGLALASGTNELYIRNDGTVFTRIKVSWDEPADFFVTSGGTIQIQYKKSADASYITLPLISGDITNFHILDVQDGVNYDVRVRAWNALQIYGAWTTQSNYLVVGKTEAPSNVTGFAASIESFGIRFSWDKVPDLDVKKYEIRFGNSSAVWATAQYLTDVDGTTYSANIRLAETYKFLIKAVDTSGNYSAEATAIISSIVIPEAPVTTIAINGANYLLRWLEPNALFSIDSYEIAYGSPSTVYADRTLISTVKGLSYQDKILWSGNRKFWVTAIDVAGNYGTPYEVSLGVSAPTAVTALTVEVLDQNVLLRWEEPSIHTLSIDYYKVSKGADYDTSILLGTHKGTFSAIFEMAGGTYTYWVVAVDTAGNIGTPYNLSAIVRGPVDFVLLETGDPDNSTPYIDPSTGTGDNFVEVLEQLLMPIDDEETWTQHFVNNSYDDFQDAIDDGLTAFIQPVPTTASWERVLDYGATLTSALITLSFTRADYDGTPDLTIQVGYSNDNVSYTMVTGQQVFATNFRYVKIVFEIA
jgi:hypothetical protein